MKKLLFTIVAFTTSFISYSQSVFQEDILQGEKLIEAYFTPIAKSFGASLNNGWYNTAKPHKLGGFDITFTLNTVIIPNSGENFKIKDSFGNIFNSNETEASTIFGSNEETEMTYLNSNTGIEYEFDMPGGLKIPVFPLPMIQAGIGLIKKTAIDIRYMPMLNVSNNINVNLLGVGVKHDLLQWIPVMGDAIPMSLSLQGGYTSLNTELKISDQDVALKTNATTINLIASKKILMITGYAGIGYNSATTTFTSQTKFNLDGILFEEKIETSFKQNKNLRTNVGLRLNLTIITIQADYTFSEYPTTTIGIGVSLR
tara:strand:+ start:55 stop:996 length:942 start_codon:yes stop_codon:yes gene_type:complete